MILLFLVLSLGYVMGCLFSCSQNASLLMLKTSQVLLRASVYLQMAALSILRSPVLIGRATLYLYLASLRVSLKRRCSGRFVFLCSEGFYHE